MKTPEKNSSRKFAALAIGAAVSFVLAAPTVHAGAVVGGAVPAANAGAIDYANAIPMPLPQSPVAPVADSGDVFSASLGVPGSVPGAVGNGKQTPVSVPVGDESADSGDDGISPQEFGTSNHPFTTKRVDMAGAGANNTAVNGVSLRYPYRATGKLYFKDWSEHFRLLGFPDQEGGPRHRGPLCGQVWQKAVLYELAISPGPLCRNFALRGLECQREVGHVLLLQRHGHLCSWGDRCGLQERHRCSQRYTENNRPHLPGHSNRLVWLWLERLWLHP